MSDEYDPDKTLEEYGYGKSGKGKTVVIVLLILLLLVAVGASVFIGRLWSDEQSKALGLDLQVKTISARLSELEGKNAELSSLLADKQAETDRLREEWTQQVALLEEQHKDQLQRTYGQMNEIVYDSKKTLSYIGDIETRLREGQNIDKQEAAELSGVINGLAFLHQQYKKPLNEFRELDRYFTQQLASIPANQVDPREQASFGKKLFGQKKLKAERAEYFENQGRRSAIVDAKNRVATSYANAQRQMANVSLDINTYLSKLDQIVASNERSAEDVAEFFETSKEILKIHDKIMSIEPPSSPSVKP